MRLTGIQPGWVGKVSAVQTVPSLGEDLLQRSSESADYTRELLLGEADDRGIKTIGRNAARAAFPKSLRH